MLSLTIFAVVPDNFGALFEGRICFPLAPHLYFSLLDLAELSARPFFANIVAVCPRSQDLSDALWVLHHTVVLKLQPNIPVQADRSM